MQQLQQVYKWKLRIEKYEVEVEVDVIFALD